MAAAQVVLSAVDWAVAAWVFYALLPRADGVGFGLVLGAFLLAQVAGVASQVPGGLGVFETVALWLLTPALPAASVLGSLLAFRAIYYLAPLFLATALLGAYELLQRRGQLLRLGTAVGRLSPAIVAPLMAFATFAGGAILLFSGATPGVEERLRGLERLVPLAVIEGSHFVGSLIGATLLLLAQGLARRLDAAWHLAVLLLGAGIVASLLKGWDYEEAALLAVLLLALLPCRRYFRRRSALLAERFSPRWLAAIGLVLAASLWLALFAHKHVELDRDLWWQVSLFGDAPRALRAAVGSVSLLLIFAVARLLRPAAPGPVTELVGRERDAVRAVVAASPSTEASLALLGDKSILFASSGRAFIMYGTQGRAWIALGDPVGPREEWAPLAWRLREDSDLHGGWAAFYQASAAGLPIYVDLGLSLIKLGEEARVPLPGFSISGDDGKKFRHLRNKLEREGCRVERIEREDVPALLPELKAVSDAWLHEKSTREKRFSIGCFEEEYLREFPAVVVRRESRVLAFANLLLSADREEVSVDLMRHLPDAPHGVMDFLLLELMLRGREEGYRYFNLGMAPLAGLQDRQLAPLWNRLGALVFRHGEHFYNFQGVRAYKEKFNPVWEPRYLASPSGLAVPRILAAVSSLIGGGLKGVVSK
jgi:phosphatidylglycerol lysyltransferase